MTTRRKITITHDKAKNIWDGKGIIIAWDTTCMDCGSLVRFHRGCSACDSPARQFADKKPDDTARCYNCWLESCRKYREGRKREVISKCGNYRRLYLNSEEADRFLESGDGDGFLRLADVDRQYRSGGDV